MEAREQRGLVIAATSRGIKRKSGNLWSVPSQQIGHICYHVNPEKKTCTCLDHQEAGQFCKHLYAVKFVIQREFQFDEETGTTTEIETMVMQTVKKTTYKQNWSAYDAAQINEKSKFLSLLSDLCKGIEDQPQTGRGRPRIPLADAIYCAVLKFYSTVSSGRCISDIVAAKDIESTFAMLKAKFGDSVRSKTEVAMKNEVLAKILSHNICCLISAIYELGIAPTFWTETPSVQNVTSA